MSSRTKTGLFLLFALWLWLYLIFGKQETKADAVQKTEKDMYIEKWAEIGQYKYEETQAEKKRAEAKAKKDALLQELNTPETIEDTDQGLQ